MRGAIHVNGTSLSASAKLQKISFIAISLLLCFLSVEWFVALRPMVKAYHQTHQLINLSTHQLTNSPTHQLINSSIYQLTNLPTHQLINLPTHQLTNSPIINSSTQKLKSLFLFYNVALILTPF